MSVSSTHIKNEDILRKNVKAVSQKCNFKYLVNNKTNRSQRNISGVKQNGQQGIPLSSARKMMSKTGRIKTTVETASPRNIPLTSYLANRPRPQEHIQKLKTEQYEPNRLTTNSHSDDSNNPNSYLYLDSQPQTKTTEIACMTQQCYDSKEQEIKMHLLQKERDDMWNSIAEIVKENQELKAVIAQLTINANNIKNTSMQTQMNRDAQCVQTQFENQHWQEFDMQIDELKRDKDEMKTQIDQTMQLCHKIVEEHQLGREALDYTLRNMVSEVINISVMAHTTQFQQEKSSLLMIHKEQLLNLQNTVDQLSQTLQNKQQQINEHTKSKQNIQKLYQKQIVQLNQLITQKQQHLTTQIQTLQTTFKDTLDHNQLTNKNYLIYIESINKSCTQKQKLYSTLLSQSHKTIRNLMNQMKQFQSMANSNYNKYLKSQRSHAALKTLPLDPQQ